MINFILVGDQLDQCACNCRLLTSVKVQVAIYFLTAINKQLQIAIIIGTLRQTPKRKKTDIADKSLPDPEPFLIGEARCPVQDSETFSLGVRYWIPSLIV